MTQPTDEQLLAAHRKGDPNAFRTLIERYRDDLYRFLYRLVGSKSAAEDVFQETFLQVHVSADSFDVSRRFRPWLFTIAANKGRDHLRRKVRRQTLELSAPVGGEGSSGGSDSRPSSFVDLMEIDIPAPEAGLDE